MSVDGAMSSTPSTPEEQPGKLRLISWSQMGRVRQGRLILGVLLLLVAVGYTYQAFQIPPGALDRPGAGFFPRIVGFVAIAIMLILILESVFSTQKTEDDLELPQGEKLRLVIIFFFGTLAFVLLLPILGQYITGAVYSVAMIKFLGKTPWWRAVLWGVVLSAGIAFIFINLLLVSLPQGIIFGS
ncbi:MAG: hypothetical protein JWR04_3104 [Rhodoglobus sp.]|jgi:putative tricarboxylic transport membrane protein|nr:hypothetical protein [Rhodoglobus sp.]